MLYFSSLCKVVLNSWLTASESDALNHDFNSCKYECFWPKKRAGMRKEEGRCDKHECAYPHLKTKKHLLHVQILATQLTN